MLQEKLMKLIDRAQIFDVTPDAPQPDALNWRYRVPGETYGDQRRSVPIYQAPRAINWRFRWAAEV
jgi:hypothetical protein